MYNEKPVADFTKAELNKSDRPTINLYEQPSVTFAEYEYGLFMYEGEVYLKVSAELFYAVSSESSAISLSDSDEIYPLIPANNQILKSP